MDRKVVLIASGALASVGIAVGAWSVAKNTGGASSREFGRVGMSVAPPAPDVAFEGGDFDPGELPEGERVIRMSPEDLPEGMRMMIADDGMDPSSFNFPTIEDEDDAFAMLGELREAVASKASGATAYRQSPPIGKQRFAESAVAFVEPFILESARPSIEDASATSSRSPGSERGVEGLFYGSATALAALDVAQLRVGDAPEHPVFELPPEVLEGLPTEAGSAGEDGERRVEMSFVSSGGGWTRHESNHPAGDFDVERPEGRPLAELSLPLKSERLGGDVLDARLVITMWWEEGAQQWRPGNTTLSYLTEGSQDENRPRRRRMEVQR